MDKRIKLSLISLGALTLISAPAVAAAVIISHNASNIDAANEQLKVSHEKRMQQLQAQINDKLALKEKLRDEKTFIDNIGKQIIQLAIAIPHKNVVDKVIADDPNQQTPLDNIYKITDILANKVVEIQHQINDIDKEWKILTDEFKALLSQQSKF